MTNPFGERALVFSGFRAGVALLTGALPLLSCSNGVTGPSGLGGVWKLQSMELAGAPRFEPDNPERFTVVFLDDGRIGVVADCNQCGGTYSLSDGTLSVPPLACTSSSARRHRADSSRA